MSLFQCLILAGLISGADIPYASVDLAVSEETKVTLPGRSRPVPVRLVAVDAVRDRIRGAVRRAVATVRIAGQEIILPVGNYQLPTKVGDYRIDCPVTRDFRLNADKDFWGLEKDARLRIWEAEGPLLPPGTVRYPTRDRWFASDTQMANEPTYVNGDERPDNLRIYYHTGLDIGGCEGLTQVLAATGGRIVSLKGAVLAEYRLPVVLPRADVLYLEDERGWLYRYSHFQRIDRDLELGARVEQGTPLGLVGKEGQSGGWSHLHFEIYRPQPSGKWGTEEGYAFLWEAYGSEHPGAIRAVARPHQLVAVGERVILDARKSNSAGSALAAFEWLLSNGKRATGTTLERIYERAGTFSEVVRVTDAGGRSDHDFTVVQVIDGAFPGRVPPTIHAAYHPTLGIRPGTQVTFKVRTFRARNPEERIDFGDGSAPATLHSDGNRDPHAPGGYAVIEHSYAAVGDYLVRVESVNERSEPAQAHLRIHVEPASAER